MYQRRQDAFPKGHKYMVRMISKTLKISTVALPLACFSMTASAALILDDENYARAGVELGDSHYSTEFRGETISFGQLTATTAGQVQFQYLYKEAGYTNNLVLTFGSGSTVFSTATTSAGQWSALFEVAAGPLPFGICTSNGTDFDISGRCAYNDDADSLNEQDNGEGYRSIGFLRESDTSWVLFWDDSGASNDDDFDDLVARVQFVAAVPEPGTLALLGLGLLGVGLMRRRS
jgi:hypothetical protein